MSSAELQAEVLALRCRTRFLLAIVRLAFLLVRLSGFRLDSQRVPDGQTKRSILSAIASAQKAIPLAVALRVLRLPPARFHILDDRSSCPRTTPAQLTAAEIATIGGMVQDASFRHMSLRALALHAQRMGRVFAAVSTWARLVRERGWLRPRRRLYPAKSLILTQIPSCNTYTPWGYCAPNGKKLEVRLGQGSSSREGVAGGMSAGRFRPVGGSAVRRPWNSSPCRKKIWVRTSGDGERLGVRLILPLVVAAGCDLASSSLSLALGGAFQTPC
jgi:hypothetical protein